MKSMLNLKMSCIKKKHEKLVIPLLEQHLKEFQAMQKMTYNAT